MTARSRHLIAYAAAMIALLVWEVIIAAGVFSRVSDFGLDVIFSLVSQIVCMGVVPLVVLLVLNRGKAKELALTMRYKAPRDLRSCLLICLGMMVLITPFAMAFNAISSLFLTIIGYKRSFPVGTVYLGRGDLLLMLFLSAVLPAVFEEFSHRGVLLSGLQDRGSEFSAVVISAVMFGLMHGNPQQFFFTTIGGLVFGVAAIKCDCILPAMCAHFANNAVSTILDYSQQKQNAIGVWYEKLVSSNTVLSSVVLFFVLAISVYGMVKLLQYAARKAPKPVSERKLFGLVTLDAYSPDGKATLKDNAFLYATMVAEGALLLITGLWGIVK